MTEQTPATRRKFLSAEDELSYLYEKFLHWFYGDQNPAKARPYAIRMQRLLNKAFPRQENIFFEECRSLIAELQCNLKKAIHHREKEIELIHRFFALAKTPEQRRATNHFFDASDLADRLELLALVYQEQGNLEKAQALLRESQALARQHGFPFDGQDILQEVEEEMAEVDDINREIALVRKNKKLMALLDRRSKARKTITLAQAKRELGMS